METSSTRILIVDDAPEICRTLKRHLEARGLAVRTALTAEAALAALTKEPADVLLADFFLGEDTSEGLVRHAVEQHLASVVFCMTGSATPKAVVAAMKAGCTDVIEKPFDMPRLDELLAPYTSPREEDLESWRAKYAPDIVGQSPALLDQLEIVRSIADTDSTVLVTGETGTGKELIARAIHNASPRRNGPFVAVNCAAIPESMIEDELFGHARGSFTGALSDRTGRILSAHGGTLFLDEIGDMPLAAQAKLLRVLQDRCVIPVGSDRAVPFDARIVAATNRDLEAMVDGSSFRGDLLFRLSVMTVELPPLRDRPEDVLLLAQSFVEVTNRRTGRNVSGFDDSAAQLLAEHPWPGNVRGLANVIERAVILKKTGFISARDLGLKTVRGGSHISSTPQVRADTPRPHLVEEPRPVTPLPTVVPAAPEPMTAAQSLNLREAIDRVERDLIDQALKRSNGNRTEAAALLGLNRTTLVEKLRKTSGT